MGIGKASKLVYIIAGIVGFVFLEVAQHSRDEAHARLARWGEHFMKFKLNYVPRPLVPIRAHKLRLNREAVLQWTEKLFYSGVHNLIFFLHIIFSYTAPT